MADGVINHNDIDDNVVVDGHLTVSVVVTCIVAASAGLIFGYDVGVSGGVTTMEPFLKKFFPSALEKMGNASQSKYCTFDNQAITAFTSSLYIAGLVSSLLAGYVTMATGRKGTLVIGGIVFLVGTALDAFAVNLAMLIIGRLLLGFGIGFANQAAPVYLSEMAPPKWRGALSSAFQFFLSLGVVIATLVNFGTSHLDYGWRIALGCAAVPAGIMTIGALFIPDTPSSLIQRGKVDEARKSLNWIRGIHSDTESELNGLINSNKATEAVKQEAFKRIFTRPYRPHLVLTVLIPAFQQLTGINVVAFYAPVLFRSIGWGSDAALLGAILLGAVNLCSVLVATYVVDRIGRRFLFVEAGVQTCVCQVAMSILLALEIGTAGTASFSKGSAIAIVVLMCCISAAFGWSWGPLTWLVPSEILPMEVRPAGLGIGLGVNFIITFILAQTFLSSLCQMKYGIFLFFAGWMVVMTTFVILFIPETKGIRLESMGQVWRKHWYWHRFVQHENIDTGIILFNTNPLKKLVG